MTISRFHARRHPHRRFYADVLDVFVVSDESGDPSILQPTATTSAMGKAVLAPGFVCVDIAVMECGRTSYARLMCAVLRSTRRGVVTASPFDARRISR